MFNFLNFFAVFLLISFQYFGRKIIKNILYFQNLLCSSAPIHSLIVILLLFILDFEYFEATIKFSIHFALSNFFSILQMAIIDINFEHYKLYFIIIAIGEPTSFIIWKAKLNLIHLFLTKTN